MSVEQLEQSVLSLPEADRRRFAHWFHEHESEISGGQAEAGWEGSLSEAQTAELSRRSAELDTDPGLAVPVTGVWFDRLKRRLVDAHSAQTPSR